MAVEAPIPTRATPIRLEDRYTQADGEVFLSGIQALVRMLLDQHRADTAAGLRTAIFASGYPGSPLGGFDRELESLGAIGAEHELVHRPGVNEELAATAVWGSQLASTLPGPRYDGVVGVWYGKTPGVDRASDALRHANFGGSDPRGGMVALCGDDPEAKSSTLPTVSETVLAALHIPVLVPGSVQEVLDLGRHAVACSRASGLWSALKISTIVADATATALAGAGRVVPVMPEVLDGGQPYVHKPSGQLLPPASLELERTLLGVRTELARAYARANGLNTITAETVPTGLGVVTCGSAFHQLAEALDDLGAAGHVRILKLGMVHPLDPEIVREFAAGLHEIVVVEEKGPFVETAVKDALYGSAHTPLVTGKRDDGGAPLVPATGVLNADVIARAIGPRLLAHEDLPAIRDRVEELDTIAHREPVVVGPARTPHFCSGCPHSVSTRAPDDALVGAGIGCHTMIMLTPAGRGQVAGVTQMGGEGAQWIGAAPFIEPRHLLQNLGDGTFHHSGSLAIRAAVAANLDVTYKLLYNQTVAMTGGQTPTGQMSVAEIAQSLEAEGVKRIIVTTEDTGRYSGVALPKIAEVRDRSKLAAAQRELAQTDGVTVLIHDQACATEVRRARKRGTLAEPGYRVVINERVCEGCGDCGAKSGCLSLEPVQTEFGRKTRIDQTSCNTDLSCLDGDCPAFMRVVEPKTARDAPRLPDAQLPEPAACVAADDVRVRLVGIGGTGVVTVSQVLGMASLLDGRHAAGLDQTGLSQKAGPVVSDVRLTAQPADGGVNVAGGHTDVLLGFDILGSSTAKNLAAADPQRTVAVVSTSVSPTVGMVIDVDAPRADVPAAVSAINAVTRSADNVFVDAHALSLSVFGNAMPANVIVLGAAWQRGAIPVSLDALRQAITLNGVAVQTNLAAFEWGRAAVAAPDVVEAQLAAQAPATVALDARARELADIAAPQPGELRRRIEIRVDDLLGWGGTPAAQRYVREVAAVRTVEEQRMPGSTEIAETFATGLHKLMAYKDEYEVARLHLDGLRDRPRGTKVTLLLHPPLLRAMGMDRKVAFGRWFVPVLALLRRGRRLRGTPLDPFGHTKVRRTERALPSEYIELVTRALQTATPATAPTVRRLAALPDVVRGYEELKLANVERFRADARMLLGELDL
jgi:indolepyruvate ferredoxin oxidoreductase